MARYTGPAYKKARRLGFSILETGKELARKPFVPGMHGNKRQRKASEYGLQLNEKQKLRFLYGLNERQFRKTYADAAKMKGITGDNFFKLLESRLDNLVYRLGLAKTRRAARQVVNHGHIIVNGTKVNIPSYRVKPGDVIKVKEQSLEHPAIKDAVETTLNRPSYVTFDEKKLEGTYVRYPERTECNPEINESLIVEYYSR